MPPVIRAAISPFYAQILLTTSPDAAHPQFETGDESVVASSGAIAIASVPDIGPGGPQTVDTEVWGNEEPAREGLALIWQGSILVSPWGVAVEDVVSDNQHHARVPAGDYEAVVYGQPSVRPSQLRILLTRA